MIEDNGTEVDNELNKALVDIVEDKINDHLLPQVKNSWHVLMRPARQFNLPIVSCCC